MRKELKIRTLSIVLVFVCALILGCSNEKSQKTEIAVKWMQTGNFEQAMETWGEVIAFDPTDKGPHEQKIFCMILSGRASLVEKYLDDFTFLTREPGPIVEIILKAAHTNLKSSRDYLTPTRLAMKLQPDTAKSIITQNCQTLVKQILQEEPISEAKVTLLMRCSWLIGNIESSYYPKLADQFLEASQKQNDETSLILLQEAAKINPKYNKNLADYYIEQGNKEADPIKKSELFKRAKLLRVSEYDNAFFGRLYYEASKNYDGESAVGMLILASLQDPVYNSRLANSCYTLSQKIEDTGKAIMYFYTAAKKKPDAFRGPFNDYIIHTLRNADRNDKKMIAERYQGALTAKTIQILMSR